LGAAKSHVSLFLYRFVPNLAAFYVPLLEHPQWLPSLPLGALKIEQTKFLNWEDMAQLFGSVVRFQHPQRQELERLATQASFQGLASFNARHRGAGEQSDFCFDPHTKQYTGQENVLEGWCPAHPVGGQAMHGDFIHTAAGEPLHFEATDNFSDRRQRFFGVVERCCQVLEWPQERVLSWVVDRAIFGPEVFEKVLCDAGLHLITWEKGYEVLGWPPASGVSGSMVIERARNRADEIPSYHLEYWDRRWPKEERLRQIMVQGTNPKGRSVLRLMFCRWVLGERFQVSGQAFLASTRSPATE
jgi:hypothetical protein